MEALEKWVIDNKLPVHTEGLNWPEFIEIGDKKFYWIEENQSGKLFDEEFNLLISEDEKFQADRFGAEYYLFEFGSQWYYTPVKDIAQPNLIPFKYIGETESELEMPFIHLGIHGKYELLNGNRNYEEWCKKAKFLGNTALGLAEYNTLAGVITFQQACEEYDLKPIIGETISLKWKEKLYNFKVYVLNEKGWKSLLKIHKIINVDNEEQFITYEDFAPLGEGLALVFSIDYPLDIRHIVELKESFDQIYCQIDTVQWSNRKTDLQHLKFMKKYFKDWMKQVPPILINDSYYLDKEEAHIRRTLNKIGEVGHTKSSTDQYFKSVDESFAILEPLFGEKDNRLFDIFSQAVKNTKKIEDAVEFKVNLSSLHLPGFNLDHLPSPYKEQGTPDDLFFYIIEEGMEELLEKEKIADKDIEHYYDRVEREVSLIKKGGYIDYFLILWDIIRWCREQNILVGVGRGSSAGSIVAYLLDITKIDPIEYNLLFERFFTEGRIGKSLPDIDCDFESRRRDEVVEYMEKIYGENFVCHVGSYNTFKLKQGIKDLGRIKGLSYNDINILTKYLYFKEGTDGDWKQIFLAALNNPKLKAFIQQNPTPYNS